MRALQHPAHNAFVAPNRHAVLLGSCALSSVAATTRPYGQFDAGSAANAASNSSGFRLISALSAESSNATPSGRTIRYGLRHFFMS